MPRPAMTILLTVFVAGCGILPAQNSGDVRARNLEEAVVPMASAALRSGQVETARRLYRRLLEVDPASVPARMGLGAVAIREQEPADAARWYLTALMRADRPEERYAALLAHGRAALSAGDMDAARNSFARLTDPREPVPRSYVAWGHNGVGLAQLLSGDLQGAVASMERAVLTAPEEPRFKGNLDRALAMLPETQPLSPQQPSEAPGSETDATAVPTRPTAATRSAPIAPADPTPPVAQPREEPTGPPGTIPAPEPVPARPADGPGDGRRDGAAGPGAPRRGGPARSDARCRPGNDQAFATRPHPEADSEATATDRGHRGDTGGSGAADRAPASPPPVDEAERQRIAPPETVAPAADAVEPSRAPDPTAPTTPDEPPAARVAAPQPDDNDRAPPAPATAREEPVVPPDPISVAEPAKDTDPPPTMAADVEEEVPAAPDDEMSNDTPAAPSAGYVVIEYNLPFLQFGAYSKVPVADASAAVLGTLTHWPVATSRARGADGTQLHRVRIGPIPTRAALSELIEQLAPHGYRVSNPSTVARVPSAPFGDLDAWPVEDDGHRFLQVGAFGERAVAEGLAAAMRSMTNREVRVSDVPSSRGAMLHRVRIGPVEPGEKLVELFRDHN